MTKNTFRKSSFTYVSLVLSAFFPQMLKHFDLPSIIVVDSDKEPDDQLRTMIILYRPPDPDQIEKKSRRVKIKLIGLQ